MAKKKRSRKERAGKPPPKCKAILLCDQAIVEAATGKISLVGIFDGFVLPRFPGLTKPATVFVQLVDGIGRYEVVVEIWDLQQGQMLVRGTGLTVEFPQRLTKIDLRIPIPPLPIGHAGSYDLVVLAEGQEVDRTRFLVVKRSEAGHVRDISDEPSGD